MTVVINVYILDLDFNEFLLKKNIEVTLYTTGEVKENTTATSKKKK